MVGVSFSTLLNELLSLQKTQTIRREAKDGRYRGLEPGDKLQLYWKMRVPRGEKLLHHIHDVEVVEVTDLQFRERRGLPYLVTNGGERVMPQSERDRVARRDGFQDYRELVTWFSERHDDYLDTQFYALRWEWDVSCLARDCDKAVKSLSLHGQPENWREALSDEGPEELWADPGPQDEHATHSSPLTSYLEVTA